MQRRRLALPVVFGALISAFAGAVEAETYSITATNKSFCCTNVWGIIVLNAHTATGLATGSPATPYGPLHFDKSQLVYFMTFMSWWSDYPNRGSKAPPPGFKYIIAVTSVVNASGTLSSGGGYGSFEFCPKAKGPGVGSCGNPRSATSPFNGRIAVKAGAKRFGGTMNLAKGIGGKGGAFGHVWRWLGGAMTYPAVRVSNARYSTPVGGAPAQQALITASSAIVIHSVGSNPVPYLTHTAGTSNLPLTFPSAMLLENGAGPWTTGTVYVGVFLPITPPSRTVSIMGANNRTAMGGGNLQVVSGLLFNSYNNSGRPSSFSLGWQLDITLPEPSAILGLAVGSAALLLIGVVTARRR